LEVLARQAPRTIFGHVMSGPTDRALHMAGFALAHAAFSVCELAEGNLAPFGLFRRWSLLAPKTEMSRFFTGTLEGAVAAGRSEVAARKMKCQCWALAFESYLTYSGGKVDAFTIEAGDKKMSVHFSVLQPFQPFASGTFKLLGPPGFVMGNIEGRIVEGEAAGRFTRALRQGVDNHPKAPACWQRWGAVW
jgi:hypothetical protein